jgi:hypothetical protein
MVDPTQQYTMEPCLGGVLLGVPHNIMDLVRLGHMPGWPMCWWSSLGLHSAVFMSIICVWYFALSCRPQAEQIFAKISVVLSHWSDCQSQRFDPLWRGRTEWFGGGRTLWPLWGWSVTILKHFWVESLQCGIVQDEVSQCLNGGWPNCQGTINCSFPGSNLDYLFHHLFIDSSVK